MQPSTETAVRSLKHLPVIALLLFPSLLLAAEIYLLDVRGDPESYIGQRVVIHGRLDYRSGGTIKFIDRSGDGITIDLSQGRTRMDRQALKRISSLPEGTLDPPLDAKLTLRVVESESKTYELKYDELVLE